MVSSKKKTPVTYCVHPALGLRNDNDSLGKGLTQHDQHEDSNFNARNSKLPSGAFRILVKKKLSRT
jgi:hypothetical protein